MFFLRTGNLLGTLGWCFVLCGTTATWGAYLPVEDFDDLTLGPISNQHDWVAASGFQVATDPEVAGNQVLAVSQQSIVGRKPLQLSEGSIRMFFLRFRFEDQLSGSFGLSHLTAPSEYSDFKPELNLTNASPDLRIADGSTVGVYDTLASLDPNTWYNAWMLVNNTLGTTQVWLNEMPGVAAGAGDQLTNEAGDDEFGFRVGSANDLVSFYIKTSSGGGGEFGPLYLDDLYMEDADGLNLTNPAPPLPGDYNHDGTVDVWDHQVWLGACGTVGGHDADGNADGIVDAADYTVWRDNLTESPLVSLASVPEPSAIWLVGLLAVISIHSVRSQKHIAV